MSKRKTPALDAPSGCGPAVALPQVSRPAFCALLRLGWLLLLSCAALAQRPGNIPVHNYTPKSVYIVLDGRNQGELWANSYQVYASVVGDHVVEAYMGDQYGHQYVQLTKSYRDADIRFTERDF